MRDRLVTNRRDFLTNISGWFAGISGFAFWKNRLTMASVRKSRAKVVVVHNSGASTITKADYVKTYKINASVVQDMLDNGIRAYTQKSDIGEAWKTLFPGINREKTISIKINCIARQNNPRGLASHPEVVFGVVKGLSQMTFGGIPFPKNNIIIWDRSDFELKKSGYAINRSANGVRCFGTMQKISRDGRKTKGYNTSIRYSVNGVDQFLSDIIFQSDYIINMSLLKNHVYAGATVSLKNHYGSCFAPRKMHGGQCDPYIAELNSLKPIREKQKLCICDAIFAIVRDGPMGGPQAAPNSLMFAQDPVALDTVATDMLMEHGANKWLKDHASHIKTAGSAPYHLGIYDPKRIDIIKV